VAAARSLSLGLVSHSSGFRLTLGIHALHHRPAKLVCWYFSSFSASPRSSTLPPCRPQPSPTIRTFTASLRQQEPSPGPSPHRPRLHDPSLPFVISLASLEHTPLPRPCRLSLSPVESHGTGFLRLAAHRSLFVGWRWDRPVNRPHKPAPFPQQLASGKPLRRRYPLLPPPRTRGSSPRPAPT